MATRAQERQTSKIIKRSRAKGVQRRESSKCIQTMGSRLPLLLFLVVLALLSPTLTLGWGVASRSLLSSRTSRIVMGGADGEDVIYNRVSFEYCTGCRWGLRASWMGQELLSTFSNGELNEVSLLPTSDPPGTFIVKLNDKVIWDRREPSTPGFPDVKDLKQLVRDIISPEKSLGHSDSKKQSTNLKLESNDANLDEIKKIIQLYLDGLYEGDVSKLQSAFHPTCLLTHFNESSNSPRIVPRDEWLQVVANRPSPQSLGLTRHDKIERIELVSRTTAFVKVQCALPPRFFTDSLNLLKVDGKHWQIAQKLFHVEIRSEGDKS